MDFARLMRHLVTPRWAVRRAFSPATLKVIESSVRQSEKAHSGQVLFAIQGSLDLVPLMRDVHARAHAIDVFSHLRVWDTEHNNGILIYVLLADRNVEIVADRGIHKLVAQSEWETICRTMERQFRAGEFEAGALAGIESVTSLLAHHFPRGAGASNELPDKPVLM